MSQEVLSICGSYPEITSNLCPLGQGAEEACSPNAQQETELPRPSHVLPAVGAIKPYTAACFQGRVITHWNAFPWAVGMLSPWSH